MAEFLPTLSIFGNRSGMNVYSGNLAGSFFKFDPNIRFHSQFTLERNEAVDRRVKAAAWYVEPGHEFSTLPWSPQLNLRYAHFSGDPNPQDRLKQTYDPLFTTGGDRGFGSWFLGEIFGQYISPNSNLNVVMAHLKFSPLDTVEADLPTEGQTRGPSGGRYRSRAALFRDHEYCRFRMRQNVVTYSVKNSSSCAKRSQINSFCLRQNISTKPVDNLVDNIGPAHARQSDFDDS